MAKVKIDNQEYDTETMSDNAKAQMASLALCDRKINELRVELAITETARRAYALALKGELAAENTTPAE